MEMSFYVGRIGASACMEKLSTISNNLANVNTTGFKPKTISFSELINYNLKDSADTVTDLQAGAGIKVQQTSTSFQTAAITTSTSNLDFAILDDNAFFMVQDPDTKDITYTRNGHFYKGEMQKGTFYLLTEAGKMVLDTKGKPIRLDNRETELSANDLGVVTFANPSRLLSLGDGEYTPSDENVKAELLTNPNVQMSALERSGTDTTKELTRLIECQTAYSYALKMVSVSGEVTDTINKLRG